MTPDTKWLPYRDPKDEIVRPPLTIVIGVISVMLGLAGTIAGAFELFTIRDSVQQAGAIVPLRLPAPGRLSIAKNGFVSIGSIASTAPSTLATATPTTLTTTYSSPEFPPSVLTLAIISGIVDIGLAIYLLTIGIMMLCNARSARALHRKYIVLKPLGVALAVWASWCWNTELNSSLFYVYGMTTPWYQILVRSLLLNLPTLVYPFALLIALSMPSMLKYYKDPRMATL